VCRGNACSPCLGAEDCPEGLACIDGLCREPACRTDEDCPAGLACKGGVCETQETASVGGELGGCDPESIYFDFDSAEIEGSMRRRLQVNYECLAKTGGRVVIEGHCDPRGTTEYNMALGERRARITRKLLKGMGMEPGQMRVVSRGEEEAAGYNDETWAKDRRVDFE
jgi:peptidoglycan-associated lipoprotein